MLDGQYCDRANVSIRLDKMMDFYRVNLMISVEWEGVTTPDFAFAQIRGILADAHVLNFIKFFINCNSNEAQISYQFKYYSSMLQCSHCLYHHSNIGFLSDLHLLVSRTEQPLT